MFSLNRVKFLIIALVAGSFLYGQDATEENMRILSLTPGWAPANLGHGSSVQIVGTGQAQHKDSFVVVLNGVVLPDSIGQNPRLWNINVHMIDSFYIYKSDSDREQFKARHGFLPSAYGIIEITTAPDTLSEAYMQQHPELRSQRRRVEGYVTDEGGKPLSDAWVCLSENHRGTATDTTGYFIIWVPRTDTTLNVYCDDYNNVNGIEPSDTVLTIHMTRRIMDSKERTIIVRGTKS